MKCIKCDHSLPDDSLFCQYCGSEQSTNTESAIDLSNSAPMPNSSASSIVAPQESFDTDTIMKAKDPLKALMEEHAKETIRVMEANRAMQPNNEDDPEFGLVPEKPIYTLATDIVEGQRAYLGKLRTVNGEKITWKRLGPTSVEGVHGMIDIYETFLPSGQPYATLYINMYGARKSVAAPQGFVIGDGIQKASSVAVQPPVAKPIPVPQKISHAKTPSKIGFWITIVLLILSLGISLFFNYSQYTQVVSLQKQVVELQKIEENSNNYKKLLSEMENVNGSNYKTIGTLLDKLPAGYEDTSKIRTQYNELKKYISAIESSKFTTRSCDELRTAYVNLNSFNKKYHNWDVSDYLKNGVYKNHFKKLVFGREWTDGTYELYWYEDGDGERLSTNLPNGKKSWAEYYFTTSGYGSIFFIGYKNQNDSSDEFDAFKIVDVIYSNGTWSISVYCYSNGRTYTLK